MSDREAGFLSLSGWWIRRVLPWVAAAVLSIGGTLLVMLPVAWLAPVLAYASHEQVELAGPEGSLWDGQANVVLAAAEDPTARTELPARIHWHTAFWPLLMGHLRVRVEANDALPQPVELDASLRRSTVSAGTLNIPASLLSGLGAPFNTLGLEGRMRLEWAACSAVGQSPFCQMTLSADQLSSRMSRVSPLGSYRFEVVLNGQTMGLVLKTTEGPLRLDGNGGLDGGRFQFNGRAQSDPSAGASLAGLLSLLGIQQPDGSYALTFAR